MVQCAAIALLATQCFSAHAGPACVGGNQVASFNLKIKAGSGLTVSRIKIQRQNGTTWYDQQKTISPNGSTSLNGLIDNSNTSGDYEGYTVSFETSTNSWTSGKSLVKSGSVCGKYTINGTTYDPSASKSNCNQKEQQGC